MVVDRAPSCDNDCPAPALLLITIRLLTNTNNKMVRQLYWCEAVGFNTANSDGELEGNFPACCLVRCFVTSIQFFLNWSK